MTPRFILATVLALSCAWPASISAADAADREAELDQLRTANEKLTQQVAELKALVEVLRSEVAVLTQTNRSITAEAQSLERENNQLEEVADAARIDQDADAQGLRLVSVYEHDEDRTVVSFGPEPIEVDGSPGAFHFSVVFAHPGQTAAPTDDATLFIQTARAGRLFHGKQSATFEVDGETMTLPIADVQLNARQSGRAGRSRQDRSDETVRLLVDRAMLLRLGQGNTLVLREGRTAITFERDDRAALRAVAQRMGGD